MQNCASSQFNAHIFISEPSLFQQFFFTGGQWRNFQSASYCTYFIYLRIHGTLRLTFASFRASNRTHAGLSLPLYRFRVHFLQLKKKKKGKWKKTSLETREESSRYPRVFQTISPCPSCPPCPHALHA